MKYTPGDSDFHDSYESTEDSLYKPTKGLGDISDIDSHSDDFNSKGPTKIDFREKHIPASSRRTEKVIDTDDSSYEDIEEDESSDSNSPAPVSPPIKPKLGRPPKNRRKDKDEGGSGSKTRMKRKYNPIRCMFCGKVGHNKKACKLKKQLAVVDPNTEAPNELPNDAAHVVPVNPVPVSISLPPLQSNAAPQIAKVRGKPSKLQVSKGRGKRCCDNPKACKSHDLCADSKVQTSKEER
ncbi:hypothetical protein Ahy_A09g045009 [Arachis hypogaea]|uniref:CCHC-type domain-containing protein n=1 Tax=Arachis hypogaea TaxID=3818 RepID=A0A445BLB0_ARAHY|nr:hypothetical protein Ahy_A09g045009 [Arachis hypogaea]